MSFSREATRRTKIQADGRDLSFVTVIVTDETGWTVPRASDRIHFDIEGPAEIVVTDNGDPTSLEPFQSHDRKAFNGLCLVIISGKAGQPGEIRLTASAERVKAGTAFIKTVVEREQQQTGGPTTNGRE